YAKIIFWSIDALFRQGNNREESLKNVTRPSHIELYLFLHAYLQGIPQAILQLNSMQVLCIASSLMIVATTTVSFQRFESQKILGRLKPWANIPPRNDTTTTEDNQQDEVSKTIEPEEDESVKRGSDAEGSTPYLQPRTIATNEIAEAINEAAISLSSENSSEKFSEQTPELLPRQSFIQYSENPYTDPRTLIKNFPSQDSNSDEPQSLRPPSFPPPPPPPRSPPPIRKPLEFPTRKIPVKGLEQDELMGKSVSFLAWFFFLSGRVISLVSCFHFFPWLGFGISLFHYTVTLLVLHKNAKTISTVLLK
ncbi:XK-related protein, partial [Gryllus bimaculatus]